MDKRQIIKNYIWDNYRYNPGYYAIKKDYFMEYSFEHWACEEILYRLALLSDRDPLYVIQDYIYESQNCLKIAKRHNGKYPTATIIFSTAIAVGRDIEELLRAMR